MASPAEIAEILDFSHMKNEAVTKLEATQKKTRTYDVPICLDEICMQLIKELHHRVYTLEHK